MTQRLTQQIEDNKYTGLVTPLPGSPDIAVSHAVYCMKGGGKGVLANLQRLNQIEELGYIAVMCVVCTENSKQRYILRNNGWEQFGLGIDNPRTGNKSTIWIKTFGGE